ncbi:MAG TPA: NUDIX domain-containing protein [Firmicutes bacterium]|nr:NUDIX domain-containing protein [Bacillota bacterium]
MNRQLQERYGDEQVLVIPATSVEHLASGLQPMFDLEQAQPRFIFRHQAEQNPQWRQLIPYIVLRQGERLWLTRRLATQGESRLHNKFSLGVGGHINPIDAQGLSPLMAALYRELEEELYLGGWQPTEPHPVAIINDLSNAVSRDHLGVVFILDVPPHVTVAVREQDKMLGQWVEMTTVRELYYEQLESWSQIVLAYLEKASQ